jgi:DNA-binding NtrC family response regulator
MIEPHHLPSSMTGQGTIAPSLPLAPPRTPSPALPPFGPVFSGHPGDAIVPPAPAAEFPNIYDEIRELERKRIMAALQAAGGVRKRAAELIGMPLRTFADKMRQLEGDDTSTQGILIKKRPPTP